MSAAAGRRRLPAPRGGVLRAAAARRWLRMGLCVGLCMGLCVGLEPLTGCAKKEDVIVETAAGVKLGADDIDRDPLALLPGGAVSVMRLDATALFASPFGQRLVALTRSRLPLPPSAGFEPARDLRTLHIGLYSMQGVDFAMVASGNFDPTAIERAADGTTMTPLGAPLVKTRYAERTLYVSRNLGFVVLTPRTVLFGDETGIRRALDRIRAGRVARDVPPWLESLLQTPNAPMVAGVNVVGQPGFDKVASGYPFLSGLQTARIVGNFQDPGMNFAGTLGYADAQQAASGAASLEQTRRMLQTYSWFMALAGLGNPIERMQVEAQGKDARFVAVVQAKAIEWLVSQLAAQLGVAPATLQANQGPSGAQPAAAAPMGAR